MLSNVHKVWYLDIQVVMLIAGKRTPGALWMPVRVSWSKLKTLLAALRGAKIGEQNSKPLE